MSPSKIAIIIVNWNGRDFLKNCLASIRQNAREISLEICVVDNASSDKSAEMVRAEFPEVRLVETGDNLGFGAGCNRGLKAISPCDYVLFLNPDTTVNAEMLEGLSVFLDQNPKAGAVSCSLYDGEGNFQQAQGHCFPSLWTAINSYLFINRILPETIFPGIYWTKPPAKNVEVDWISGAVMMVRGEAIPARGFFDETYFMYGEDMEASCMLNQKGWRLFFLPHISAIHHLKKSTGKSPSKVFRLQVTNFLVYLSRHARPWELPLLKFLMLAGYGLRGCLYALKGLMRRDASASERGRHHFLFMSYVLKGNPS